MIKILKNKYSFLIKQSLKYNYLQSFFSINLVPTGSRDPFALRRAGNSIIKILIIKKIDASLTDISNVISLQKVSNQEKIMVTKNDELDLTLVTYCVM